MHHILALLDRKQLLLEVRMISVVRLNNTAAAAGDDSLRLSTLCGCPSAPSVSHVSHLHVPARAFAKESVQRDDFL